MLRLGGGDPVGCVQRECAGGDGIDLGARQIGDGLAPEGKLRL
jgi:hypothetical protein